MAYTQADLETVQRARVLLNTTGRVQSVTVGTTRTEYQLALAADAEALEAQIRNELNRAVGGATHVVVSSSKGL